MPTSISRDKVQTLITEVAHLVEVLPPTEYEELYLPGAMIIPPQSGLRSPRTCVRATLQKSAAPLKFVQLGDYGGCGNRLHWRSALTPTVSAS